MLLAGVSSDARDQGLGVNTCRVSVRSVYYCVRARGCVKAWQVPQTVAGSVPPQRAVVECCAAAERVCVCSSTGSDGFEELSRKSGMEHGRPPGMLGVRITYFGSKRRPTALRADHLLAPLHHPRGQCEPTVQFLLRAKKTWCFSGPGLAHDPRF